MGTAASKHRTGRHQNWLIQTLDDHESGINCMALSGDYSVIATGSDDHNIRLWSTKTTPVDCLSLLSGHTDYITYILIYENYLISASADKTMRRWDVTTGECVMVYSGHTSLIYRIICTGKLDFSDLYRIFLLISEKEICLISNLKL
jgi:WD40 repeat protein